MKRTITRTALVGLLAASVAIGVWVAGCSRDNNRPKVIQRSGRVAAINKDTGEVQMWYYHPKQKQEIKIPGKLDPKVEILVNGAAATVDDVKIDDNVRVTGRQVGSGADQQFIAIRVEVERPVTESIPPASAPAGGVPASAPK